MRLVVLSLTTLTLLPCIALAEEPARADRSSELRVERFEDELVAGDLLRSTGERLIVHPRAGRRTLIEARSHFTPEMMKSVEDL